MDGFQITLSDLQGNGTLPSDLIVLKEYKDNQYYVNVENQTCLQNHEFRQLYPNAPPTANNILRWQKHTMALQFSN